MTDGEQDFAAALVRATPIRAFVPIYYDGTQCPGCGRRHWLIGRQTAECAYCATALVLEHAA